MKGINGDNVYLYKLDVLFLCDGSGWGGRREIVSYAKQEVFKVHPMKGRWRSEEQRHLESFLCLFAFHTASC